MSARLVLQPKYLSVLDKMNVGPEEWELISLLKSPKSVLEICRESMLGDFRSCQILWALRILGGVGEAPIEMAVDTAIGIFDAPAPRPEVAEPVVAVPEPDPEPLPVSDADTSAEVISEPWRLAALRRTEAEPASEAKRDPQPEPESEPARERKQARERERELEQARERERELEQAREPESAPAMIQIDSPADATIAVSREDVEAAIHAKDDGLPHFEIGAPGTGVEDMKIDMAPAAPEPAAVDETFDRTVRVSREELEAALTPPLPPETSAPMPADEPPFTPPAGLDGVIASFNARHVILFRALRAEIGAGAANFVKSCRAGLDDGVFALFATADLRADGSWDPEGLKHSVVAHRITDAGVGFEKLLDGELKRLRAHLGEARAAALAQQLASIPLQSRR